MATSQKDQNTTWSQCFASVAHMFLEIVVRWPGANSSTGRQVALVLLQEDNTFTTILCTTDFLHDSDGYLGAHYLLGFCCLKLIQALALILSRSRPFRDSIAQVAVVVMAAGHFLASRCGFLRFFRRCHCNTLNFAIKKNLTSIVWQQLSEFLHQMSLHDWLSTLEAATCVNIYKRKF